MLGRSDHSFAPIPLPFKTTRLWTHVRLEERTENQPAKAVPRDCCRGPSHGFCSRKAGWQRNGGKGMGAAEDLIDG